MRLLRILGLVIMAAGGSAFGQFKANYDESKVPRFALPDPLKSADGRQVTAKTWHQRRAEILELFTRHVYGRAPKPPGGIRGEIIEQGDAFDGLATRRQIRITGPKSAGLDVIVLIYTPRNVEKPPVFLGPNFLGNHSVCDDSKIKLSTRWIRAGSRGVKDNRATEASRGSQKRRWPVPMVLKRGYALATIYYGDIDPDYDDGFKNGVHQHAPPRSGEDWGSIAGWAWGLSRVLDYFETADFVDSRRLALLGHSRLGKTALWAGATDDRFALVISNNSGCGGAALSRRAFGETVGRINTVFPHWFCDNFTRYNNKEHDLPVDQHMLVAAIAPRPVYIASAVGDRWADPRGEFLAARHADPVYRLLGTRGLPEVGFPEPDQPIMGQIGYHIRSGGHDVKEYDWKQYLTFADRHFGGMSKTGRR